MTPAGAPPSKATPACEKRLFLAADHARKIDPTLAARYQRLMTDAGRHHSSALCTLAGVLLTRIVACLRSGQPYQLCDVDGRVITPAEGRAIIAERYQIPAEVRAARRAHTGTQRRARRNERTQPGVAKRSKVSLVPTPA